MTVRRRLSLLERRWPVPAPGGPEREPVPLPPLAEFRSMTPERQRHVLLGWDPVLDEGVDLPWPAEPEAMTDEELRRLIDALERAGRETLLPYVESLPLGDRIDLAREATRQLPPSQIWRVQTFRFACRPEWKRRLEGRPDEPQGEIRWA